MKPCKTLGLREVKTEILLEKIKTCLTRKLPGEAAHREMAPVGREESLRTEPENPRESAVLIALFPENGQHKLCFIRRPEYDGVHSGQIAFPGGGREASDSDLKQTALREAAEEVNIKADEVEILGELSAIYIPPSNYIVKPFVGITRKKPDFVPEPAEVAGIIGIPLEELLENRGLITRRTFTGRYSSVEAPCYKVGNTIIWGATAMILSEFLKVLRDCR